MYSFSSMVLLAFSLDVYAKDSMNNLLDGLVDNLFDRALQASPIHNTALYNTTLGKPGNLAKQRMRNIVGFDHTSCGPLPPLLRPNAAGHFRRPCGPNLAANIDAPVADPRKSGLALLLDDGTRKSHSVAENSAFVTGFFRGIAEKKQFAQLVADLYFVYAGMEGAFAATKDENVRVLDYPALRRVPELEKDMEYYFGPSWRSTVEPSPATAKYVARIEEVARTQPTLLIAHQYTRYLGDLFGGQMMGGMASKSLGLEEGKGIAFYNFADIPDTKEFITEWYTKLNDLKLTEAQKQAIVDEANLVFQLNIQLFDELDGNPIAPLFRLALDALRQKLGLK